MVDQFLSTNDRIKLAQTLDRVYEMPVSYTHLTLPTSDLV